MKLGIVGKGGVGKTTTAALLAQSYAARDRHVVVIDTDSNPNLGISLGMTQDETEAVPELPRSLIVGRGGDVTVDDLMEAYGRPTPAGVTLLSAIRVTQAGAGCTCGGHATVRSLLSDALVGYADMTIVDMEAGLEHLSRSGGTLAYADVLLMIMEPSRKSILTAQRTLALADELGIPKSYGVGNKARMPEDAEFFRTVAAEYGVPLAGIVPHDPEVVEADRSNHVLGPDQAPEVRKVVAEIAAVVDATVASANGAAAEREALLRERERVDERLAQLQQAD